jgi:hypothetical protein
MLEASGSLDRLFAAFRASLVSLHAELIFPLPGDWQIRELIFDPFSHLLLSLTDLQHTEINFTYFRPGTHQIVRTYLCVVQMKPVPFAHRRLHRSE